MKIGWWASKLSPITTNYFKCKWPKMLVDLSRRTMKDPAKSAAAYSVDTTCVGVDVRGFIDFPSTKRESMGVDCCRAA